METPQSRVCPQGNVSVNRTNMLRSIETEYERMLLDEVPGTFTSLRKSDTLEKSLDKTQAGKFIIYAIQNPPLVAIAVFLFVLGTMLTAWLFWKRKSNYIWLVNRLFIPTFFNAAAGLLTSLVNIYTAKKGNWSIMALLTVIITSLSASGFLALVIIYKFGKLVKVKQDHELELRAEFRTVIP